MWGDFVGLRDDAYIIIEQAIKENLPGQAVTNALAQHSFSGEIYMAAIGKAAWTMAKAARDLCGGRIRKGIVITKYGHSMGDIPGVEIIESGHPILDENTIIGAEKIISMAQGLGERDELLFLISGGGSALFEKPLEGLTLDDVADINKQLLSSGADIVEINMIRKRLSSVKGGRFAQICAPAGIFTVVLSDVLGDRLDSIASGPAAPDMSTVDDAMAVLRKYNITVSEKIMRCLERETPKSLSNVETVITGSVRTLCAAAAKAAAALGYEPLVLCTDLNCEAREAGRAMSAMARQVGGEYGIKRPCAIILGGETVVRLKGGGMGGRNQELALAAAEGIDGMRDTLIFSVGSDGTDGPTDAAGGIVDGSTMERLRQKGIVLADVLDDNDAYHALKAVDSLIMTGPTGTNVNDVSVILCGLPEK